jgi:hypothetical protein
MNEEWGTTNAADTSAPAGGVVYTRGLGDRGNVVVAPCDDEIVLGVMHPDGRQVSVVLTDGEASAISDALTRAPMMPPNV